MSPHLGLNSVLCCLISGGHPDAPGEADFVSVCEGLACFIIKAAFIAHAHNSNYISGGCNLSQNPGHSLYLG